MNKQEAISKTVKLNESVSYYNQQLIDCGNQILECKTIIDAPEPKTGRVMSVDDLGGSFYRIMLNRPQKSSTECAQFGVIENWVDIGIIFHDAKSCEQYIEYLKLEQELRVAQIADGGTGIYAVVIDSKGDLEAKVDYWFSKVSFKTRSGRDIFTVDKINDQLELLIRGV